MKYSIGDIFAWKSAVDQSRFISTIVGRVYSESLKDYIYSCEHISTDFLGISNKIWCSDVFPEDITRDLRIQEFKYYPVVK
jgi:hypothetical protein